jgi:hypothetical protein
LLEGINMADYFHKRLHLQQGQAVEVEIDRLVKVMLLTDANFEKYKRGRVFYYYGGSYRESPVTILPPRPGIYHLVIDPGRKAGEVRYSARIIYT